MRIFLDLDGVLTDFPTAFNKFYNCSIPFEKFSDLQPETGKTTIEIDGELTREFWATLPWLPTGKRVLRLIEKYYGRYNICLLSFPSFNPEGASGKIEWIKKNLPDYSNKFLLGGAKHFCANSNSILFDDKEKNIYEFNRAGGLGILVPAPYNRLKDKDILKYLDEQIQALPKIILS